MDFRDFAFISSVKSEKFCEHIEPSAPSVRVTEEGEEVAEIDYGDTELWGREYMELEDNEMYLWLRVSNHHPDLRESVRLIVTPVQRQCSSTDIFWTPCSSSSRTRGPCVRRDLLCDGIVNCGQKVSSIDESPEVCRSRVKPGPGVSTDPLVASFIGLVCLSVLGTGALLCCCKYVRKDKRDQDSVQPPSYLEDGGYQNASAPPASIEDSEDSPPSYTEAMSLRRP